MHSTRERRLGESAYCINSSQSVYFTMQTIADVFALWPTDADIGRDIGMPYSTVAAWKQRGSIPVAYWRDLIRAAQRRHLRQVTADVLVDLHARDRERVLAGGFAEQEPPPYGIDRAARGGLADGPSETLGTGHFSQFKHLRRNHFGTAEEIEDHICALREEWSHR